MCFKSYDTGDNLDTHTRKIYIHPEIFILVKNCSYIVPFAFLCVGQYLHNFFDGLFPCFACHPLNPPSFFFLLNKGGGFYFLCLFYVRLSYVFTAALARDKDRDLQG